MNVLLIYPALPLSYWSFPKALGVMGLRAIQPPLGLLTVAAMLPAGWQARLVDLNVCDLTGADWRWADTVMVSGMWAQRAGVLEIVRQARGRGKTVIAGGVYASANPQELLAAGCHCVIRGEAEGVLAPLLADWKGGPLPTVMAARVLPDLADAPLPRFDLVDFRRYESMPVQTTRGCPFDCEFCDVVNLFGRRPRTKPVSQVMAELERLYRLGVCSSIFFCDDNFIGSRSHALELLEQIAAWNRRRGEPFGFITQASIDLGRDPEMIERLTAANFGMIFIGIESPDKQALAKAGKRQNRHLDAAVQTLIGNGLVVQSSFILGMDGEKRGTGDRIVRFVEDNAICQVMLNLLNAPPGSRLWQRLEREGRLRGGRVSGESTFATLNFRPERPETEILEEYAAAWEALYRPELFLARNYRNCLAMRPTRSALWRSLGRDSPYGPQPRYRRKPKPARRLLGEVRCLGAVIWDWGVRGSTRGQFWRQLIGIWQRNPSRLRLYLINCVQGWDLCALRLRVQRWVRDRAAAGEGPGGR